MHNKKLLFLGGIAYLLPVIQAAKELGIYTITCDYMQENLAHKHSDEFHNISILDKEKVLQLAKELKIDGILSFAVDPGVVTAAYVADQLGLPMPGPLKSVEILQNKAKFRAFLSENNFNVPLAKGYNEVEDALQETELFNWPVIVKPVDSAGSKGVTKVINKENIQQAIEYAIFFSASKEFIIEEFIETEGFSSDSDCFSINGELVFTSFSSQHFDQYAQNPFTPSAYSWPSELSTENKKYLQSELQRLFSLLEMRSSVYNVEVRVGSNGKAYIMECSPRGGGNRISEVIRLGTGVDLIKRSVQAAIGDVVEPIHKSDFDGYWGYIVLRSDQEGEFQEIIISDEFKPNIAELNLWVKEGDHVEPFTAANKTIGNMIIHSENKKTLEALLSNYHNHIKIVVSE